MKITWIAVLVMAFTNCRNRDRKDQNTSVLSVETTPFDTKVRAVKVFNINQKVGHGDEIIVDIDPSRKLSQVTPFYHGVYSIPDKRPDGTIKRNSRGATYYRDGIYASGYIKGPKGDWIAISWAKFVGNNDRDIWRALDVPKSTKLKIEFRYGARYLEDKKVLASKRKVDLRNISVTYKNHSVEQSYLKDYNPKSQKSVEIPIEVATAGILIREDETHSYRFDATGKTVYKIVVRWGDAKPRKPNGDWNAGTALGALYINNDKIGKYRNVGFIEDQIWDGFSKSGKIDIGVKFKSHFGRIHHIKIFYTNMPTVTAPKSKAR